MICNFKSQLSNHMIGLSSTASPHSETIWRPTMNNRGAPVTLDIPRFRISLRGTWDKDQDKDKFCTEQNSGTGSHSHHSSLEKVFLGP